MKKKKNNVLKISGIILLFLIILFLIWYFTGGNQVLGITDNGNASAEGNGDDNGIGGGGGTGAGNGDGTNGEVCPDCTPLFLEGNPLVIDGIFNKPTFIHKMFPMFAPKGHWNCNGTCPNPNDNCVINPTDEIPEGGFDNIFGEKPNCVCLPKIGGPCNFYDNNYGEGVDDIQCAGGCPTGQVCTYWIDSSLEKEFCKCLKEPVEDCEFHFPEGDITTNLRSFDYEELKNYCYGDCPPIHGKDVDCIFWIDQQEMPRCECEDEIPEGKINCPDIDTQDGSEWWKCWTDGYCDNKDECVYNQRTKDCECQDPEDCGWHITYEQIMELKDEFDNLVDLVEYLNENIDYYCYGGCIESNKLCEFRITLEGLERSIENQKRYLDCECFEELEYPFDTSLEFNRIIR